MELTSPIAILYCFLSLRGYTYYTPFIILYTHVEIFLLLVMDSPDGA